MRSPKWATWENELLHKWYPEFGPSWDRWAELLPNRTYKARVNQAAKIGAKYRYRGPKSWTKAEDRLAVAMLAEVCKETKRSPNAVIHRLAHLIRLNRERSRKCA